MRFDYQATQAFRVSFKYSGFSQREQVQNGSIPGWNDTRLVSPNVSLIATTANYSLTPTLFLEGTFGRSKAHQGGCFGVGGGGGPQFCNAFPVGENADLNNIGLSGLPCIFPRRCAVIDDRYFVYDLPTAATRRSGRHARAAAAELLLRKRITTTTQLRAAEHRFPARTWRPAGRRGQPHQGVGPHTIKTGFYTSTATSSRCRGAQPADPA